MYLNVSLDEAVFTHIAAVGNKHFVHCDVTGRSRQVSTSMFLEGFILIFKQTRNISIKRNVYLCHLTNILRVYCDNIPQSSPKVSFIRMSTPQCHEINVMTFDAECHEICFVGRKTNVMTFMSWDLENVMRFILSRTGARKWLGSIWQQTIIWCSQLIAHPSHWTCGMAFTAKFIVLLTNDVLHQGDQIHLLKTLQKSWQMHILLKRADTYYCFRMPNFSDFQISFHNKLYISTNSKLTF